MARYERWAKEAEALAEKSTTKKEKLEFEALADGWRHLMKLSAQKTRKQPTGSLGESVG